MYNKEKLKHLPVNLFLSLGTFGIVFGAFTMLQDNIYLSIFIGLVTYLNAAMTESKIDYLNEQVENLKSK